MLCFRHPLHLTTAFALLSFFAAVEAAAQRKVALVIGNSAYKHTSPLPNPQNDAKDLSALLKRLDFEVIEGYDLDKPAMDRAIRGFAEKLSQSQLALFFYAGHGLQVGGQNYLAPIDAELASGAALDFEMVRLDLIQRTMERESTTNILILDACRDNPLARNLARSLGTRSAGIGKGLAVMESGEGTLISFSTQPGNVALDGTGRNSPFARALLKHIATPGDDLPTILINVRNDVMAATDRRQVPWEHSALTAKVYFIPPKPSGPSLEQQIELSFWSAVKDVQNPSVLRSYLERYPDGMFAGTARALIAHYEQQAKARAAERAETLRREEEQRKAAELRRLEEERRLKEAILADERRRAAETKDSTAARLAEEKARAEARERDELLRKALEEVIAAREAARQAVELHAAALKEAEEAKQKAEAALKSSASPGLGDASQTVAARPARSALIAVEPKPDPSTATAMSELAYRVNRELERVGCRPGKVERNWTTGSQNALKRFAALSKRTLPTDKPTQEALDALAAHSAIVCRPVPSREAAPSRPKQATADKRVCRPVTFNECVARRGGGNHTLAICSRIAGRVRVCK